MSRYSFLLSLGVIFVAVEGMFVERNVDSSASTAVRIFAKGGWCRGVCLCNTDNRTGIVVSVLHTGRRPVRTLFSSGRRVRYLFSCPMLHPSGIYKPLVVDVKGGNVHEGVTGRLGIRCNGTFRPSTVVSRRARVERNSMIVRKTVIRSSTYVNDRYVVGANTSISRRYLVTSCIRVSPRYALYNGIRINRKA